MQLKWGTYPFPVSGVKVTSGRKVERAKDDLPWRYIDKLNCDGFLEGTSQADLTAKQLALEAALLRPFRDLVLVQDDGSASATLLSNADSITGVVVTDGPNFADTAGSEYATQRHFTFAAEADYPFPQTGPRTILEWSETVAVSGGGPLYVCKPALVGPPQRQLVYEQTACLATQTGFAVGRSDYPLVAPPLWPFALKEAPEVRRKDPTKRGQSYTEYRIEWSYSFEWPFPLVAAPTRWPR